MTPAQANNTGDPMDKIEWTTETEHWTWPFTDEQRARLTAAHASGGVTISVFGIGPDRPDLILAVGPHDPDHYESEDGDSWCVRFGLMALADFGALPEHGGW